MIRYILLILLSFISIGTCAQIINQNQQNININVPVIEKKVYIEKYRTVYIEKPRIAKKLNAPIQLLGYLWVYPEDIGNFNHVPTTIIANINAQTPYGRNNWRIPTPDELAVLEANADKVGLGNDIYLATDHRNGVLRLVSTGQSVAQNAVAEARGEYIVYAGTKWAPQNYGAPSPYKEGIECNYLDITNFAFPQGWRLPTISELKRLCSIENCKRFNREQPNCAHEGGRIYYVNGKTLVFPFNCWWGGEYWGLDYQGNITRYTMNGSFNDIYVSQRNTDNAMIRLVKE